LHAVDPKDPPVVPVHVEGDQVPAPAGGDETVRLHQPEALPTVPGAVLEAEALAAGDCPRHFRQEHWVDLHPIPRHGHRCRAQDGHASAESCRQDLLELGKGPDRRFVNAGDCLPDRGAEPDGDGHCLLIVEEERGHRRTRDEPIPANRSERAFHRVTQ
jgi:hypothetical protein